MIIFETKIKDMGNQATEFLGENMIILFGSPIPQELKDFCFEIQINEVREPISVGMYLKINDETYSITAVGDEVQANLTNLGHITIKFDSSTVPKLPGTLYVENKKIIPIQIDDKISISK